MTKFYRETQFKETEIGRIPSDWKVVKLGDVFKFSRGYSYRSSEVVEGGGYKLLTINNFEKGGGFTESKGFLYLANKANISQSFIIKEKSLFVANTDMSKGLIIGSPILVNPRDFNEEVVYSMDLTRLIPSPSEEMNLDYVFYLLKYSEIRKRVKAFAQGTNVLHLNHTLFKNLPIPLPPIEEQRAIAGVLRQFDELVEVIDKKIESLQRIKKGLMDVYFTRGVFEHRKFKETEIGRIPEDWEVVKLGDVVDIKTGPFGSQLKKSELTSSGVKVYSQENVLLKNFSIGDVYVPNSSLKKFKSFQVKPGDLLVTIRGTVGKSAIVPKSASPGIIHSNLAILRENDGKIFVEYLNFLINDYQLLIRYLQIMKRTTIPAIYGSDLRNIKIPLPPIEEQREIARRLKDVDDQIENLREQRESVERMKKRVMDLLLTGKVRVKEVR